MSRDGVAVKPDVRIVRLGKQRDDGRTLLGRAEQDETDGGDGGASDIVRDIADSHVQQLSHGAVVGGAGVRGGQRQRGGPAQYRVLVPRQLSDAVVGLLQSAVQRQREADRETSQDLFVLGLTGIRQHVGDGCQVTSAELHQADGNTSRFTCRATTTSK